MGRGGQTDLGASAPRRASGAPAASTTTTYSPDTDLALLDKLEFQLQKRLGSQKSKNPAEMLSAIGKASEFIYSNPATQRQLIQVAQSAQAQLANPDLDNSQRKQLEEMRKRSIALLVGAHDGFIEGLVAKHAPRFKSEDRESAHDVIKNIAREGMMRGIDAFNLEIESSSPLAYLQYHINRAIGDAAHTEGRLIRLPGAKARLGDKIEEIMKDSEFGYDGPMNTQRIVDKLAKEHGIKATAAEVQEIEKHVGTLSTLYIDKEVEVQDLDDGFKRKLGPKIQTLENDEGVPVHEELLREEAKQALMDAVESLNPAQRLVIEARLGIGRFEESGPVAEQDLYLGVYVDKKTGKRYANSHSAKPLQKKYGEDKLEVVSQKEINHRYKEGELEFHPSTEVGVMLTQAVNSGNKAGIIRTLAGEEVTGTPHSIGTVQNLQTQATTRLRQDPRVQGHFGPEDFDSSYGPDAIKYSEVAAEKVRNALEKMGAIQESHKKELQARNRPKGKGRPKGETAILEDLGKQHGLIKEDGSLEHKRIESVLAGD